MQTVQKILVLLIGIFIGRVSDFGNYVPSGQSILGVLVLLFVGFLLFNDIGSVAKKARGVLPKQKPPQS